MSQVKLLLGDTLDKLGEMPDESVHFVCTSPPYPGVQKMWGDFFAPENFDNAHAWLDKVWDECVRVLKPGCKLAINISNIGRRPYLSNSARVTFWGMNSKKVEQTGEIIWHKHMGSRTGTADTAWGSWRNPSDMHLTDSYEYILIFRKFGERQAPTKDPIINREDFLDWRKSMWQFGAEKVSQSGHIAPFPIEIPRRLITLYTFEGETVLDPFIGSGTTALACEMLKRDCIGIDHSLEYIQLSQSRLDNYRADKGEVSRPLPHNLTQANAF